MQVKTKNSPVPRAVIEAFYRALAEREVGTLASYLDDDVVWTISGPVDIGQRGEAAGAGQSRVSVRPAFRAKYNDGHAISYRIAHFIKFHEEKVVKYVSIIDSFDAVEQMLGYNLDAHDGFRVEGDIVAV